MKNYKNKLENLKDITNYNESELSLFKELKVNTIELWQAFNEPVLNKALSSKKFRKSLDNKLENLKKEDNSKFDIIIVSSNQESINSLVKETVNFISYVSNIWNKLNTIARYGLLTVLNYYYFFIRTIICCLGDYFQNDTTHLAHYILTSKHVSNQNKIIEDLISEYEKKFISNMEINN